MSTFVSTSNLFLLIIVFITVSSIIVFCTNFSMSCDIGLLVGRDSGMYG